MLRILSYLSLVASLVIPARGACPLELRSYEDLDGRGFVLELDPPAVDAGAQRIAVARILHGSRGEIARFDVVTRPGYGSLILLGDQREHSAYFFTQDLRSTRSAEGSTLLFVEGLGLADWQLGELPESRDHPLGDVVWKLVGCKE
jgi:hypothetical protein